MGYLLKTKNIHTRPKPKKHIHTHPKAMLDSANLKFPYPCCRRSRRKQHFLKPFPSLFKEKCLWNYWHSSGGRSMFNYGSCSLAVLLHSALNWVYLTLMFLPSEEVYKSWASSSCQAVRWDSLATLWSWSWGPFPLPHQVCYRTIYIPPLPDIALTSRLRRLCGSVSFVGNRTLLEPFAKMPSTLRKESVFVILCKCLSLLLFLDDMDSLLDSPHPRVAKYCFSNSVKKHFLSWHAQS